MAIMQEIETKLQKGISVSTDEEVYYALLELVKDKAEKKVSNKGKKKLYYISAEFLIGKLLSNNLINLGIYDEVKETLEKNGKSLAEIEEIELEPSLGNGGLGRLAACFIDSIATLGLNGDGVGLNYHYGLFKHIRYSLVDLQYSPDYMTLMLLVTTTVQQSFTYSTSSQLMSQS